MNKQIRIAIIGTGNMARSHVENYQDMDNVQVVACTDLNANALAEFCTKYNIENQFTSLDELLTWGDFDGISNVTPDNVHYATTMQVIAANKHILCEKPLATNYAHAKEMADAANKANIINMVNLSYRNVAAVQHAAQMVASGAIGDIKHFEASYLQSWLTQPAWGDWQTETTWLWRLSTKHGSKGVLGDVGIHIIDYATYIAGSLPQSLSCQLHTYHKAKNDQIGEYPLDANDSFVMNMQMQNNALGTISATRFASGHHNDLRLRIYGDKGGLEVLFENGISRLNSCLEPDLESATWHEVKTPDVPTNYDRFIAAIRGDGEPEPTFERGAQLQKILDFAEQDSQTHKPQSIDFA